MSRVAQLDAEELSNEVHSFLWKDFQSHVQPTKYKEELKLLIDTLAFYFGCHYSLASASTTTYASQLSGVSFQCHKRTLYLITILAGYLHSKISHFVFNSSIGLPLKVYTFFAHLYTYFDLLNSVHFLLSISSQSPTYLSPLHRLLRVSSSTDTQDLQDFYKNTVYSGIEFQNRQLLWNAILEFFNIALLNNTRWFLTKPKASANKNSGSQTISCPHCGQFPVNPHQISCCKSIFCYICAITTLEWSHCDNCGSTKNLKAIALY